MLDVLWAVFITRSKLEATSLASRAIFVHYDKENKVDEGHNDILF